jgi:hypothetical protein
MPIFRFTEVWTYIIFILFGIGSSFLFFTIYINFYDPYYKVLRKKLFKGKRKVLFSGTSIDRIEEMAADRSEKIYAFLDQGSPYNLSEGAYPYERRPRLPFIELIDGTDYRELFNIGGPRANYSAQIVSLNFELKSFELLLANRLVDALVNIYNRPELRRNSSFDFPVVKIEPYKRISGSRYSFPWVVVLETEFPEFWSKILLPLEEWIAIRVEIAAPIAVTSFARCQRVLGKIGVAGGLIECFNGSFLVTCRHVPGSYCPAQELTYRPEWNEFKPDVAVLNSHCGCFPSGTTPGEMLDLATAKTMADFLRYRAPARKIAPGKQLPIGTITARVIDFSIGDEFTRFPHIQINTRFVTWFGCLIFPMFDRHFSKPGESGTWVVEEQTGLFVGMIVAGDDQNTITYLLEAEPMLENLRLEMADNSIFLKSIKN